MSDLWSEDNARALAAENPPDEILARANGNGHVPEPERYRLTDQGLCNWLQDLYGEDMVYVSGLGWLTWHGGRWVRNGKDMHLVREIYKQATISRYEHLVAEGADADTIMRFARQYETNGKVRSVLEQCQHMFVRPVEDVDGRADLLNCRNGVVDLRSATLLPHDRDYLQTHQTPGDYVPWTQLPESDRERFTTFLRWATSDDAELMRLCCRSAGYTLTGETSEESLFLLWGTTRSGKSTLSEAMASVMGEGYAGSLDSNVILSSSRARGNTDEKIARVALCRLVNCAEPERGQRFTESLVKMITSGDKVDASFKYMASFEFIPRWKLWVSTNHAPGSGDIAVHRRLIMLPFRHTVPINRQDVSLKPWLKDPNAGGRVLLSWAVEGARAWYEDGLRYADTAVSQEWMDEYVEDEDPVGLFINSCLQRGTMDKDLWPGTKELYAIFERWNWSELQNTRVMGFQRFNQALQERNLRRGKHPVTGARIWREVSITWDPNSVGHI